MGFEFGQAGLQDGGVIIFAPDQGAVAIRANRTLGETRARLAGGETASAALQAAGDAIAHRLFRNVEPYREIERLALARQKIIQTLRLADGAGEPVENKAVLTMKIEPVCDQLYNDVVRNKATLARDLGRFQAKRGAEIAFAPQDCPRGGHGDREMPGDHLRLRSLAGTGCAEKNDPAFHCTR